MIVPPAVERKHNLMHPYLADVAARVRDTVAAYCEERGYAYLGREKARESLAEKIETGRFSRWSELDDLFACCIIIPTPADESRVLQDLGAAFKLVGVKSRETTQKDPTVFRYDATRFIGTLLPSSVPSGSADILAVRFEIQVRTAFEHAWSVTTHALAYKSAEVDWRNVRLAAQLKAAVEQLDQVVLSFENAAATIVEQSWPEIQARQLVERHFRAKLRDGLLPTEAAPQSWTRFCENLHRVILSSTDRNVRDHEQVQLVERALGFIDAEMMKIAPEFPRSVSLLQFCIGALAEHKFLQTRLRRYTPLLTTELHDLYPAITCLGEGFDLEFKST